MSSQPTHMVFVDNRLRFEGDLNATAKEVHGFARREQQIALIFETDTGRELDLDLRGSASEVADRYPAAAVEPNPQDTIDETVPRKRGRPKLGVVGREITLLPRHWQWLDTQRGGASAALRRLVDGARKESAGEDAARAAQDRTQRFLTTIAGNQPGFEEAVRALYARDGKAFRLQSKGWPDDVQTVAGRLAAAAFGSLETG